MRVPYIYLTMEVILTQHFLLEFLQIMDYNLLSNPNFGDQLSVVWKRKTRKQDLTFIASLIQKQDYTPVGTRKWTCLQATGCSTTGGSPGLRVRKSGVVTW